MTPPVRLELVGIGKRFGAVVANDSIDLRLRPGEIHAVLGENGAGKSTLMLLLYGVLQPDSGSIVWEGREVSVSDPGTARRLGIGMVFQHFSLLRTLSVRQNLQLAYPDLDEQRLAQVLGDFDLRIELDVRVGLLSPGEMQRVEILRCLLQDMKLLILDEPTSVLTPAEVEQLVAILRKLAQRGCSVLFITHKLDEARALCREATVLRGGRVAGRLELAGSSDADITRLMLGGEPPPAQLARAAAPPGATALQLRGICAQLPGQRRGRLENIDLSLASGEILGIAGVSGSGQEALAAVVAGEIRPSAGSLWLDGEDLGRSGVRQRRRRGIRVLPVDRLHHAAAAGLTLDENYLLSHYDDAACHSGPWLHWGRVAALATQLIQDAAVRAPSAAAQARQLSGGNLQKFLVGRELAGAPRVLVCYNPTWGVDPGAQANIHAALAAARNAGMAILLLSEDTEELYRLCDRLGALCDGRLSPQLPTAEVDRDLLGQWMTGAGGSSPQRSGACA
ncbi:ABC transporter ATP-binding protein [Mangrovimicrobium sediminis]|uniref:ABC transporter ATP-binding protein n=1 Tax=Mangrovimicrobium sediminis TaxID=2562682 RepID=A0A4Z0M5C2_9GAMM|nr:ABC transporter ATP-binding protein [Haliea sp. SAOS-164]TGD74617.1 ABC transporter ATP-binding protein [Haliea sp. SAOS-164]